jgi:hypothetical protein
VVLRTFKINFFCKFKNQLKYKSVSTKNAKINVKKNKLKIFAIILKTILNQWKIIDLKTSFVNGI